jgi:signal transduction histidine kinase/DNA-binding transcriptional ArsR family regulator
MALSDEPDRSARVQVEQDVAIARALGDSTRLAILRALAAAKEPLGRAWLAAVIGLSDEALVKPLATLRRLGAIIRAEDTVDGAGERYQFAATPLARTLRAMLTTLTPAAVPPESNGTLDAVLDQMASGAALYDATGELVRLNPAGERITRRVVREGEDMGQRLARYQMRRLDGTPMPVEESPSGRALRGEVVTRMECVIDGQHGPNTWLRCSAAPLKDAFGAIQGAVVIFDDITEQRRLSHEEARQRTLAETMIQQTFSGMAVFDVSDAFHCLRHNDNFARLFVVGTETPGRETLVGVSLNDLFTGEFGVEVRAIFEQVRATGEPYFSNEFSATLAPNERSRWYRWRITPLRDDHGAISELLTVAIEITDLVTARETSLHFARELSAIIEAMPEAVMLADHDGQIMLTNSAVGRILGNPIPMDIPVNRYHEVFHTYANDGRRLEASELPLVRALQGETVVSEELAYQRLDGSRIDLLTSAAPVDLDDTGRITGAVAVFQDISQIRALERQRDDFLGIAAHELRTPLATILATLQAFSRRLQTRPADQAIAPEALASGMERMYRQAQRLNALVSDLLDSTRIRTGKLVYDMEPCDLALVVSEAVAGEMASAPNREIALGVPDHPVMVLGDAFRLSQVVDNLVSNALKYSPEEEPVAVTLDIADVKTDAGIRRVARLRVADHGVGIPAEDIPHVFERFYRAAGVDVQAGAGVGLGLGLDITSNIVERHSGQITVTSTPGAGSTFAVTLPLLDTRDTGDAEGV